MNFSSQWLGQYEALGSGRSALGAGAKSMNARPEKQLHSQILSFARARGWIALHGDMTRKTGRTLGEPDFVIIADAGRVFFVEAKSMIGVLSPAQVAFRARARDLGHTVHIVRSLDDFITLVAPVRPSTLNS